MFIIADKDSNDIITPKEFSDALVIFSVVYFSSYQKIGNNRFA